MKFILCVNKLVEPKIINIKLYKNQFCEADYSKYNFKILFFFLFKEEFFF